jgi:hypothetical protein
MILKFFPVKVLNNFKCFWIRACPCSENISLKGNDKYFPFSEAVTMKLAILVNPMVFFARLFYSSLLNKIFAHLLKNS